VAAGCSSTRPLDISLGAPDEVHDRLLNRIAGKTDEEVPDAVLRLRLSPPPHLHCAGGSWGVRISQVKSLEVPPLRTPDYGLYASPIR
jgi:hypothetical protein